MINNRQNGRRRGRGGGQRQGGGGQGQRDSGNRIDSRARGNANQLYEKYKNMARDAQMSGDRVTTEYYLQFADHYFRVLMDQRGRFDDQPQQRRPRDDFDPFDNADDDFGSDFSGEGEPIRGDEQPRANEGDRRDRGEQRPREERQPREPRVQRDDRPRRSEGDAREGRDTVQDTRSAAVERLSRQPGHVANDVEAPPPAEGGEEPRRRRTRKSRVEVEGGDVPAVALGIDRLPPALGLPAAGEGESVDAVEEAPKPRRRRVRGAAEAPNA